MSLCRRSRLAFVCGKARRVSSFVAKLKPLRYEEACFRRITTVIVFMGVFLFFFFFFFARMLYLPTTAPHTTQVAVGPRNDSEVAALICSLLLAIRITTLSILAELGAV